ncbi:MAG TPA: TIGR03118 family protein [Steroidobacteraceae bacterium]|nr:TIGR03118 family protein [Steroidobacteraceae bacterium]
MFYRLGRRAAQQWTLAILTVLTAACGGGSYGGGGGTPPATVTISLQPSTITLGQSSTLTWTTNGTGCTASGAWTGAQSAGGTQVITPTAIGTQTYTITCTGGAYGASTAQSATLTINAPSAFSMSSLVSDGAVNSVNNDVNLKNPWGIVFAPGAPVWVANNATQTSTLYDGNANIIPLVVNLPAGANGAADATGIVNSTSTTDFMVTNGTTTAPARFIFAGQGGTILGWAPTVDQTHALIGYDDAAGGASYTGLAIANNGTANLLYAADFKNGKIDVFDATFTKVTVAGGFTDATLPAEYSPFGIQAVSIGGTTRIVIAYAKKDAVSNDEVVGAGLGVVNVFDLAGTLVIHLVPTGGDLNAPWGITMAPASFGTLGGSLLIGNFGDGTIHGYNPTTGAVMGALLDAGGTPIASPGLWGIAFGNGARNQPVGTLFFAAGIADEVDGLYGRIDLGATPPDIVAPTVALTAPAAGNVTGTVAVSATAADDTGVTQVEFFAGTTSLGVDTTAPYSVDWNTTASANGVFSLTAVAKDAAGNTTTSAVVSVTVANVAPPPDVTPPTVALTAPPAGNVSGTIAVSANAADNIGVTQVEFFAGATSLGVDTTAPYSVNWDTTAVADGAFVLTAVAKDAAANSTTSAAVNVTVANVVPVTLAQLQTTIFTPRCSGCHTGVGGALPGSMNLTSEANTAAALINVTSVNEAALKRVLPGDPDNSYIIHKLEGTQTVGVRMPANGPPYLDQATINMVRAWIQAGAAP